MGRECVVGREVVGSCGREGGTWVMGREVLGWWGGTEEGVAGGKGWRGGGQLCRSEQLWWVAEVVECNI